MEELEILKSRVKELELNNSILLDMYERVRSFKHDYGNFIQILDGYVKMNSMDGVERLCNRAKSEYEYVNCLGQLNSTFIQIPELYKMLIRKITIAKNNEINIIFGTQIDLKNKYIKKKIQDEKFLCLFEQVLDNTIEAAKYGTEKEIEVNFVDICSNKTICITIESLYNKEKIRFKKIYREGYMASYKTFYRGKFSYRNIKKILENSENIEFNTTMGNRVIQKLVIK